MSGGSEADVIDAQGSAQLPIGDGLDDLDFDTAPQPEPERSRPAPEIVVFDVGEVLLDETRVWTCWADILGVSPLTFAAVLGAAIVQGQDYPAVFPHVAPNCDWEEFVDEHERRYGGFVQDDVYPDAVPCLEELKSLGFRVGIAGNQPARRRQQLLDLHLPHDALALSDELGVAKPERGFFEAVLDAVGAADPEQILYVGDRVDNDVIPAVAFGLSTCWLRRGPYGQLQEPPADLEIDIVLDGLGELPLLLQQWRG